MRASQECQSTMPPAMSTRRTLKEKKLSSLGRTKDARERVIIYPLLRTDLFSNAEAASAALCICYQYEINEHGYGPYGFDTEKSKKLLSSVFDELFFLDVNKAAINSVDEIGDRGLYFFGNSPRLQVLREELRAYKVGKTKARLLRGSGIDSPSIDEPKILSVMSASEIDSEFLESLSKVSISFFIRSFFMPVGNDTLIVFDSEIVEKIKAHAFIEDVEVFEVDSVEKLACW